MSKVRETAYNTLVRPQLEYASAVRDPHTKEQITQIEKVQRRAARWTVNYFDQQASVTKIIQELGWRALEQRPADAHLCLFYKNVHGLVAVPLPDYVQYNNRISRYCHSMTFRQQGWSNPIARRPGLVISEVGQVKIYLSVAHGQLDFSSLPVLNYYH